MVDPRLNTDEDGNVVVDINRLLTSRGRSAAVGIMVFALAACDTSVPFPSVSPKPTAGPIALAVAEATADPASCPSNALEGTLIEDPETGLGILDSTGRQWHIVWPPGYSASPSIGGSNLFKAPGELLMRSGENLRIGGLVPAGNQLWLPCGEVVKVPF